MNLCLIRKTWTFFDEKVQRVSTVRSTFSVFLSEHRNSKISAHSTIKSCFLRLQARSLVFKNTEAFIYEIRNLFVLQVQPKWTFTKTTKGLNRINDMNRKDIYKKERKRISEKYLTAVFYHYLFIVRLHFSQSTFLYQLRFLSTHSVTFFSLFILIDFLIMNKDNEYIFFRVL